VSDNDHGEAGGGEHHLLTPGGMGTGDDRPTGPRLAMALLIVVGLGVIYGVLATLAVVAALVVVIFLHELGHYVTARWSGMKVTEFFIGFGPRLWSFRRDGVEYGVKAIPAGAYVRIIGMNNLEEVDPVDEPHTYRQKSYPKRLLVAAAGSGMHFILAFILLLVVLGGFGVQRIDDWTVGELTASEDGSPAPAAQAGLLLGDRIVSIDGEPVDDWTDLRERVGDLPGDTVVLGVERLDGEAVATVDIPVTLGSIEDETGTIGFLGVRAEFPRTPDRSPGVVLESADTMWDFGWASVGALGRFFSPANLLDYGDRVFTGGDVGGEPAEPGTIADEDANRVLSPVGFVRLASQATQVGMLEVIQLLVAINIFVGIFNLIPLLPFDGGHIAVATYERIRSRNGERYTADVAKLLPLTYGVVMVLIFVGLSALWLDLSSPISNPFQ